MTTNYEGKRIKDARKEKMNFDTKSVLAIKSTDHIKTNKFELPQTSENNSSVLLVLGTMILVISSLLSVVEKLWKKD